MYKRASIEKMAENSSSAVLTAGVAMILLLTSYIEDVKEETQDHESFEDSSKIKYLMFMCSKAICVEQETQSVEQSWS